MFGNGRIQAFQSWSYVSPEEDTEPVPGPSERDERLRLYAANEVRKLNVKAGSNLDPEREFAARDIQKTVQLLEVVSSAELLSTSEIAADLFAVVLQLGQDKAASVKAIVLDQLMSLLSSCHANPGFQPYIELTIVPILASALDSPTDSIRKTAIGLVGLVLEQSLLPQDALLNSLLPALLSYTSAEGHAFVQRENFEGTVVSDEQRVEAASVLCRAVSSGAVADKAWILERFIPAYSYLLADHVFHIRKAAASILGDLSKIFGGQFAIEFAVPHVVALCKDDMWGVRKSCCEIFVDVALYSPNFVRRHILAPRFVTLLKDPSRWVSYIAFQELGPFISTFANSNITGLMLKNGTVCDQDETMEAESDFANKHYVKLPDDTYVPEMPHEEEECYEAEDEEYETKGLQQLLDDLYDVKTEVASKEKRSPGTRCKSEEALAGSGSVSSKCHSLDDLSKIGLDDDDEEGVERDVETADDRSDEESRSPPPERVSTSSDDSDAFNDNVYWNTFPDIVIDDMDITPFGASCSPDDTEASPKRRKGEKYLERRHDILRSADTTSEEEAETSRRSRTTSAQSDNSSARSIPAIEAAARKEQRAEEERRKRSASDQPAPPQEIVPPELVEQFVRMVGAPTTDAADMNRQCAHNFPAVAFTLGRANWKELRETYKALAGDHQWRVRVSLANSMHEMAAIVGSETAEEDLLPVFDQLREDVDEVRGGLLKHLADFYRSLPPASRLTMLNKLPHFLRVDRESESNWRFRLEFAKQCSVLCGLYDVDAINKTIAGIALTLATDKVAAVRAEAALLMARILALMAREEWPTQEANVETSADVTPTPLTDTFVQDMVRGFARSQRWNRRQTFLHLCEHARPLLTDHQFATLLLSHVHVLAKDTVVNVRIVAARVLCPPPKGSVIQEARTLEVLEMLTIDGDMDVNRQARLALGADPAKEFVDLSGRDMQILVKENFFLRDREDVRVDLSSSNSDMDISPPVAEQQQQNTSSDMDITPPSPNASFLGSAA